MAHTTVTNWTCDVCDQPMKEPVRNLNCVVPGLALEFRSSFGLYYTGRVNPGEQEYVDMCGSCAADALEKAVESLRLSITVEKLMKERSQ